MNNSQLYSRWQEWLMQLIPDRCETRLKNMGLLMVGLYLAQSVSLSHIARKLPIRAKKASLSQRLSRFLKNEAIDVGYKSSVLLERRVLAVRHQGLLL